MHQPQQLEPEQAQQTQQPQLQQQASGQESQQQYTPQQIQPATSPYVDIFDNPEDITVVVDLPGCDEDDIRLEGTDNTLRITANHPEDEGEEEERAIQRERPRLSERVIQLPAAVDLDDAEATCENGVCRVRLRKREEDQERQIAFQ